MNSVDWKRNLPLRRGSSVPIGGAFERLSCPEGREFEQGNLQKFKCPGGFPGGMLNFRIDRRISGSGHQSQVTRRMSKGQSMLSKTVKFAPVIGLGLNFVHHRLGGWYWFFSVKSGSSIISILLFLRILIYPCYCKIDFRKVWTTPKINPRSTTGANFTSIPQGEDCLEADCKTSVRSPKNCIETPL